MLYDTAARTEDPLPTQKRWRHRGGELGCALFRILTSLFDREATSIYDGAKSSLLDARRSGIPVQGFTSVPPVLASQIAVVLGELLSGSIEQARAA